MRKVEVTPYNPDWAGMAEVEIRRILTACPSTFTALEHIGSTAVAGLAAKPIIDLLGEVPEIARADSCSGALERLGYQAMGEYGIPGRRYFYRAEGENHTHHLHVFATGDPGLRRHRAQRDYLRAHPDEAKAYGALKMSLAGHYPNDIEAYIDGKKAFVNELELRALTWSFHRDTGEPTPGA